VGEEETRTVAELEAEARAIHRAVFGEDAGSHVVGRYLEAHAQGLGRCTRAEAERIRAALNEGLDLSAMEFVLRRRSPGDALVRKFRIMNYVTEGSADYFDAYINRRASKSRALASLAAAAFRSAWKWYKGRRLLQRRWPSTT